MRILKEIRAVLDNYQIKSGIYHFYRGEYKQAIEFLDRALETGENLSESDSSIARYYLTQARLGGAEQSEEQGESDRAIEELKAASEINPSFADIQFRLARCLERNGRTAEAIERYRRACEINPHYVEGRTALAFALMAMGRSDEAAVEFQEVFDQTVAGIALPFREGLRLLAAHEPDGAYRFFREAFYSEPLRLTKLHKTALTHLRNERWQEAADALREAILLSPGYADLHNYLGVALAESGELAGAVTSFRESVRLNPRYSIARLNLAYALSDNDGVKEAEAILETLLETDPHNSPAKARLGEIRASRVDPRRLEVRRGARPGRS